MQALTAVQEAQQKRRMDEAVVHRKRSTRIALKELEKEEERQARRKREEEEEKMSRTRRLEARQKKEEEERLRRENAREKRRKERELGEEQTAEENEMQMRFSLYFSEFPFFPFTLDIGQEPHPRKRARALCKQQQLDLI